MRSRFQSPYWRNRLLGRRLKAVLQRGFRRPRASLPRKAIGLFRARESAGFCRTVGRWSPAFVAVRSANGRSFAERKATFNRSRFQSGSYWRNCRLGHLEAGLQQRPRRFGAAIGLDGLGVRMLLGGQHGSGRPLRRLERARAGTVFLVRLRALRPCALNRHGAQLSDHPIGGLVVQRIVTQSDRTDDLLKLAVLAAPALEHDMVGPVATDGKSVVGASVHRAARLPRVSADPARVEPALPKCLHDIGNTIAHHRNAPQFA